MAFSLLHYLMKGDTTVMLSQLLGGGFKYDSTGVLGIRLRFDRPSTPIRQQFGRVTSTTIRQPTLQPYACLL